MKSLEILEIYLKVAEEEMEEDKVKNAIINNLNQIKSDLEVLEILRKYLKVICCCEYEKPNEFITLKATIDKWGGERFSNYNDNEKVVSDFNKVKQWLEENKNDR